MKIFLTSVILAATAVTMTACSDGTETNTATLNETVPASEDLTVTDTNFAATDDLSSGNLTFDNSAGLDANATDLNTTAGNGF